MMSLIIDTQQMQSINFTRASIYLDACFIVTFFDLSDHRQMDVEHTLATWAEYEDVTLAISNHTISECINTFFHSNVLTTIDTYQRYNKTINQQSNGYQQLPPHIKERIGNLDSARFLYRVAKERGQLDLYQKRLNIKVNSLIKVIKEEFPRNRELIDIYYGKAVERFNLFLQRLENDLGFQVKICESGKNEVDLALSHIRLFQLEPADAFHLAITRLHCDYLATLDSDFVNGNYTRDTRLNTKILKVS